MTDPENGAPPAQEEQPASLLGDHADIRHVALLLLVLLAILYTLHIAQDFILPIVLAILLNLLLSPVVLFLRKYLRIPEALGAGLVIVLLLGVAVFGAYRLAPAASAWIARAPESMATLQRRIQPLRRPVEKVTQAAEQVEQATDLDKKKTPQVEIKGPSLTQQVFGGTTALLSTVMVIIFLTYFLLASGDLFLQKLVAVLPQLKDKKTAVHIVRETQVADLALSRHHHHDQHRRGCCHRNRPGARRDAESGPVGGGRGGAQLRALHRWAGQYGDTDAGCLSRVR